MSFSKKGNSFPGGDGPSRGRGQSHGIARAIADALRRDLGHSHAAVKTVVRWTDVSERTAKHWLGGRYAPSGEHLVALIRHSDEVLLAVLVLAGRRNFAAAMALQDIRDRLRWIVEELDGLADGRGGPGTPSG